MPTLYVAYFQATGTKEKVLFGGASILAGRHVVCINGQLREITSDGKKATKTDIV